MASSKWKSADEISVISAGRNVFFWGASNWVEASIQILNINASGVLDNNPNNHGIKFQNLPVSAPKATLLTEIDTNGNLRPFVVITTVNYLSVIDELHDLGFVMGDDFCVTPVLNTREAKDKLFEFDSKILVSCPEHAQSVDTGGGLYLLDPVKDSSIKLLSGKGRDLCHLPDGYGWIDNLRGLIFLDHQFNETSTCELPANCEAHGIVYDTKRNKILIGFAGRDSIGVYDYDSKDLINEIRISPKWGNNSKDNHHINDLCIIGDSLFFSMFSYSGNWPNECYDGVVAEYDLLRNTLIGPVVNNLWMPHSVKRIWGKLMVLDSMRGQITDMNHGISGRFDSFIRGFDASDSYLLIGASEHRYPEKAPAGVMNIPLDAGVFIFEPKSKMSRFIKMPQITSIHSITLLNSPR